ncbi:hypothetical protein QBC47DRAFT_336635 [Echria macrotheca]|uniref:MYND-type domain-containing protein n=1 Tax=Echria macrotheca TaxID=438768 RepID=A0AAJ0BJB5_9PEZI|nr:hypothetical protein QBC47DRAFT_336635 [Echria macrotheca]
MKTGQAATHNTHGQSNELPASQRIPFHDKPDLCEEMLRTVRATIPLAIRSSTIHGSGLFALRGIDEFHDIFIGKPMAAFPFRFFVGSVCEHCLQDSVQSPVPCPFCYVARYCSNECQCAAWWAGHSDECHILRKLGAVETHVRLAIRHLLWRQHRKRPSLREDRNKPSLREQVITNLLNPLSGSDPLHVERSQQIRDRAELVAGTMGTEMDIDEVADVIAKIGHNCVKVRLSHLRNPVGLALDWLSPTINHSCLPNAHVFFEGNILRLRSLRKIKAEEEITISYIEPSSLTDRESRHEALSVRSSFRACQCRSSFRIYLDNTDVSRPVL